MAVAEPCKGAIWNSTSICTLSRAWAIDTAQLTPHLVFTLDSLLVPFWVFLVCKMMFL